MREIISHVYINKIFYKTFHGKEIKEYFLEWDDKLVNGKIIKTPDGEVKVVSASIENPEKNNGNLVTEIQLEKL